MVKKNQPAQGGDMWRYHVDLFQSAQSLLFALDTELRSVKQFTRQFFPKKIREIEEKRAVAKHDLDRSVQSLYKLGSRYLDLEDGTIMDCKMGLIGLKESRCLGKSNWTEAMAAVSMLASGSCGLSDNSRPGDWRMPTKVELPVLFEWKNSGAFASVNTYYHWSSTPSVVNPRSARLINLYDGGVYNVVKINSYYIWPLRSIP